MSKISSLSPTPTLEGTPVAGMIRAPGQVSCPNCMMFVSVERFLKRHYARLMSTAGRETSALFAVIDGPPGTGKTMAATDATARAGLASCNVPASMLAGATENAATEALTEVMRGVVAYSKVTGHDVAVILDDFHLSIAGSTDAKISRTVNTNLLVGDCQRMVDERPYRCASGMPVPIVFTGNDFSQTAPSLFRDQRANRHTHAPTALEKVEIIFHLLAPRTPLELRTVEKLVRTYKTQPIAFWAALKNDLFAAHLDKVLGDGPLNRKAIDAAWPTRTPLDPELVWKTAKDRAAQKLTNHYV